MRRCRMRNRLTVDEYERKRMRRKAGELELKANRILAFVRRERPWMSREFRVLRCRYAGQLKFQAWRIYAEVE